MQNHKQSTELRFGIELFIELTVLLQVVRGVASVDTWVIHVDILP